MRPGSTRVPRARRSGTGGRRHRSSGNLRGGRKRPRSPQIQMERREVPPDLFGLCFKCFRDGHRRDDCTFPPRCIRCGLEGHESVDCRQPRSPRSEEDLRRDAMAKVARTTQLLPPARLAGRLSPATRQDPPVGGFMPVAAVTVPAEPWQAPSAAGEICVLRRSHEVDDMERRLQSAVVAYIGGPRPAVSCVQAAEAISEKLRIPRHRFSVHKFHPEDFLVVFATPELRNTVLAQDSVEHEFFKLFFRPWLMQAQATSRLMRTQVDVMIEGIPAHAWTSDTAAELLGSSCLVESLAPETANREDLSLFKLRAWCVDPDEVPVCKRLWMPEPSDLGNPADRRPIYRQLLEYKILIHNGRMREYKRETHLHPWQGHSFHWWMPPRAIMYWPLGPGCMDRDWTLLCMDWTRPCMTLHPRPCR